MFYLVFGVWILNINIFRQFQYLYIVLVLQKGNRDLLCNTVSADSIIQNPFSANDISSWEFDLFLMYLYFTEAHESIQRNSQNYKGRHKRHKWRIFCFWVLFMRVTTYQLFALGHVQLNCFRDVLCNHNHETFVHGCNI